jgi:predicted secreted protein
MVSLLKFDQMKILPLLAILAGCGTTSHPASSDTIQVKVNETFEIKLGSSLGTGYSWTLADSAWRQYLSLDTTYVINDPQQKDNGPDTQVFRFRALSKGESALHFDYRQPWKKEEAPSKQRSYTVIAK